MMNCVRTGEDRYDGQGSDVCAEMGMMTDRQGSSHERVLLGGCSGKAFEAGRML